MQLKRIFHTVLSLSLSLLLLFGGTAKEFIHLFTEHQDTVHHHIEGDGLVIESQHHHCSFLSDSLPAFLNHSSELPVYYNKREHGIRHFILYKVFFSEQSILPSFRGPPVV
jgi:hypothetical protein